MVPNFCCITVSLAVCATFSNMISLGFCATPKAAKLLLVPVQLRKVSSNFCAPWSSMQKGKGTQSCRAEFLSACNKLFRGYWQLATSIRAEGLWSVTILYWCWAYCSRKLQRRKRKNNGNTVTKNQALAYISWCSTASYTAHHGLHILGKKHNISGDTSYQRILKGQLKLTWLSYETAMSSGCFWDWQTAQWHLRSPCWRGHADS